MRHAAVVATACLVMSIACVEERKSATEKGKPLPSRHTAAAPPPAHEPVGESPLVTRGRYLANVAGCVVCHTPRKPEGPDQSKAFAGGFEWEETFGTWRSPNITQDERTGIGDWTDAQIATAIRKGIRPDGERLLPVMPYRAYAALSDEDMTALVMFLKTVKPIENEVARAKLELPLPPPPKTRGFPPDENDELSLGKYLASIMACAECHTPMGKKGLDMSKAFAGGFHWKMKPPYGKGDLYSPNLTPDEKTGLADYTKKDISKALTEMKKKDGSPILPPMTFFQHGWSKMKEKDIEAVAAFIDSLEPVENEVPKSTFKPSSSDAGRR